MNPINLWPRSPENSESMPLSVIKYCKIVLIRWFESGKKLKLEER